MFAKLLEKAKSSSLKSGQQKGSGTAAPPFVEYRKDSSIKKHSNGVNLWSQIEAPPSSAAVSSSHSAQKHPVGKAAVEQREQPVARTLVIEKAISSSFDKTDVSEKEDARKAQGDKADSNLISTVRAATPTRTTTCFSKKPDVGSGKQSDMPGVDSVITSLAELLKYSDGQRASVLCWFHQVLLLTFIYYSFKFIVTLLFADQSVSPF